MLTVHRQQCAIMLPRGGKDLRPGGDQRLLICNRHGFAGFNRGHQRFQPGYTAYRGRGDIHLAGGFNRRGEII